MRGPTVTINIIIFFNKTEVKCGRNIEEGMILA